jgi:hypothetical protein
MNYFLLHKGAGLLPYLTCLFGTLEYLVRSKYGFPITLGSHLIFLALEIKNSVVYQKPKLLAEKESFQLSVAAAEIKG